MKFVQKVRQKVVLCYLYISAFVARQKTNYGFLVTKENIFPSLIVPVIGLKLLVYQECNSSVKYKSFECTWYIHLTYRDKHAISGCVSFTDLEASIHREC